MIDTARHADDSPREDFQSGQPGRAGAPEEPVCFVVDPKPGIRGLIANVCSELGLRVDQFDRLSAMVETGKRRKPDLVFLEPAIDGYDGEQAIQYLVAADFGCPIVLMSGLNAVLTEEIRRSGMRSGLAMLPVLQKPFRQPAVRRVVHELGLRRDFLSTVNVSLSEVLKRGWLELWYQPKIDLRGRMFAGAEGYVRARHPEHGVLPPDSILDRADPAEMLTLTQHVVSTALRDWPAFAAVGVPIRFSINVPAFVLNRLPLASIIADERPKSSTWPGMILEVNEDEIVHDLSLAQKLAKVLKPHNVDIAIDDFGRAYSQLAQLKDMPFTELKIDRSFVANCDADRMNSGLCETIIELAHRFGIKAVAEGIETAAELKALHKMGCDYGQGYLFARPMQRDHFIKLLRERGRGKPAA
jgi:EAL domain-containing protein (putative c-di-GMP-specific phosphodiesterase class I)